MGSYAGGPLFIIYFPACPIYNILNIWEFKTVIIKVEKWKKHHNTFHINNSDIVHSKAKIYLNGIHL